MPIEDSDTAHGGAAAKPLLFIHVPKTAGTSLRMAARSALGDGLLLDYGPQAPETSEFIRARRYGDPPLPARQLGAQLRARGCALLCGQVGYADYAMCFAPEHVVTVLRDPVERVVSEYHHHGRLAGLQLSLLEFARRVPNRNRQSRMLQGLSLERVACLGLSERYTETLTLLARQTGLQLAELHANQNPDRCSGDPQQPGVCSIPRRARRWSRSMA